MISDGYEERYCLFLDILGFQSHVDETVKPSQETKRAMTFQKLRSALRSISEEIQYKDGIAVAGGIRPTSRQVSHFIIIPNQHIDFLHVMIKFICVGWELRPAVS